MPQQERDEGLHTGLGLFPEGCAWAQRPLALLLGGMERVCWNKEELLPTVVPQEVG